MKAYAVDFCGTKTLREATPGTGRELRPATGRVGRERPQCAALPAQQLRPPEAGGGGMKRQVPGLAATARFVPRFPMASFSFASMVLSFAGTRKSRSTSFGSLSVSNPDSRRAVHRRSPLLHAKSDVEAGLVPAGLPLRPGTAGPRTGRREGSARTCAAWSRSATP